MRRIFLIFLTLTALSGSLLAKHGHGRGNGHRGRQTAVVVDPRYSGAVRGGYFVPHRDVVVVREYYRDVYPRGRSLPPGLQRKLARGGALPPGWQRKLKPIPARYERRLAPLPRDYRRGVLDGIYVVYEPNRGVIIDASVAIGF